MQCDRRLRACQGGPYAPHTCGTAWAPCRAGGAGSGASWAPAPPPRRPSRACQSPQTAPAGGRQGHGRWSAPAACLAVPTHHWPAHHPCLPSCPASLPACLPATLFNPPPPPPPPHLQLVARHLAAGPSHKRLPILGRLGQAVDGKQGSHLRQEGARGWVGGWVGSSGWGAARRDSG